MSDTEKEVQTVYNGSAGRFFFVLKHKSLEPRCFCQRFRVFRFAASRFSVQKEGKTLFSGKSPLQYQGDLFFDIERVKLVSV